ncbi:hypothetical protein BDV96DRAFT_596274 [Lophiotrema nucula]|uniref:Uncharacterized protein n=1 Tax=Lophiotrema nucula TaxID=690887 RepID=A0A6A5ZL35_9PLEO|nr:hypothetical protein BDV96DRAFT_596274 [Lophiotrema nucula]
MTTVRADRALYSIEQPWIESEVVPILQVGFHAGAPGALEHQAPGPAFEYRPTIAAIQREEMIMSVHNQQRYLQAPAVPIPPHDPSRQGSSYYNPATFEQTMQQYPYNNNLRKTGAHGFVAPGQAVMGPPPRPAVHYPGQSRLLVPHPAGPRIPPQMIDPQLQSTVLLPSQPPPRVGFPPAIYNPSSGPSRGSETFEERADRRGIRVSPPGTGDQRRGDLIRTLLLVVNQDND